jgi:kanamycin nucleotidyltransferase
MLDQDNRYYLALRLAQSLSERLGEDLLLCGLYGSAMRGDDTPWSDLELFCVVDDLCAQESRSFIYHGIHVSVTVKRLEVLERLLTEPSREWPVLMGILSVLEPLAGDGDWVPKWLELGESAPPERFRDFLVKILPDLVFESYGRIRSCAARGNADDLPAAVAEFLLEMNLVLCLMNRCWTTHDYSRGLADAAAFPLLPRGYAQTAPALWSAQKIETAAPLAEALFDAYLALLDDQDLLPRDYTDPSELDELF